MTISPNNHAQNIPSFLNFMATKKKTIMDWAFLHVKIRHCLTKIDMI